MAELQYKMATAVLGDPQQMRDLDGLRLAQIAGETITLMPDGRLLFAILKVRRQPASLTPSTN